jgi:hypothetical protein
MSEINTIPFENRSTDSDSDSDQDKKEQNNTDTTSPFDDPAMDLDIIDPDPEEQQQIKTTPYKTSAHNPFDDPLGDNYNNRDRYDGADIEDDSVQSMLEMMETKDDPGNNIPGNKYLVNSKNNKSLRSKARGSLPNFRWGSPPSLLGGMSDDKSLASYDCIALSSLKKVLRNEDTATVDSSVVENNDDNDEESMRSKPTRVRSGDDDAKSDGTTSTKNTVNGSDDNLQQTTPSQSKFLGRRRMKYMILLASFLAILLLLGILVLSYSLYALRNEED